MGRYVALLRGVNVGGHKPVPMADLRALLEKLGCADVVTLVQSGNVVFTSKLKSAPAVIKQLEPAIARRFGFEVPVLVRTRDELAAVITNNPLPEAVRDPSRFMVAFLSAPPDAGKLAGISPAAYLPDEFRVIGREIYALFARGAGQSKLAAILLAPARLGVTPTMRNWNTVTKLLALADQAA